LDCGPAVGSPWRGCAVATQRARAALISCRVACGRVADGICHGATGAGEERTSRTQARPDLAAPRDRPHARPAEASRRLCALMAAIRSKSVSPRPLGLLRCKNARPSFVPARRDWPSHPSDLETYSSVLDNCPGQPILPPMLLAARGDAPLGRRPFLEFDAAISRRFQSKQQAPGAWCKGCLNGATQSAPSFESTKTSQAQRPLTASQHSWPQLRLSLHEV
jgi:hypothetical protein